MKSPMERNLLAFYENLLHESGQICRTSTTLDWKTVQSRFEHEGLPFLTITLTDFAQSFQKSLDQGFVDSFAFPSFKSAGGGRRMPAFLQGFVSRVFDEMTGMLLTEPDTVAIFLVRQLTLVFGKIAVDCAEKRVRRAVKGFVDTEQDLKRTDAALSADDNADFLELQLYFGERYLLSWTNKSTTGSYYLGMDRDLPLSDFWETRNIGKVSGLDAWKSISLMGNSSSQVGHTLRVTPAFRYWIPEPNGL